MKKELQNQILCTLGNNDLNWWNLIPKWDRCGHGLIWLFTSSGAYGGGEHGKTMWKRIILIWYILQNKNEIYSVL